MHPLLDPIFPRRVFVAGTGTEVGKTVASAVLCHLWQPAYWKPIQSGIVAEDSEEIARLAPGTPRVEPAYRLQEPASPHLAARLEGTEIDLDRIAAGLPGQGPLVVEGAGGLFAPLSEHAFQIDLIARLGLPVVLVASSQLGTLNHTLLSLEALRARGIALAAIVLSGPPHGENARYLATRTGLTVVRIPRFYPLSADSIAFFCRTSTAPPAPESEETPLSVLPVFVRHGEASVDDAPAVGKPGGAPGPLLPAGDRSEAAAAPSLAQRDARCIWHPYTQHATAAPPIPVRSAHGARLFAENGRDYVDAVSSWWVTVHGHGHPVLAEAIAAQARTLEQVIFAGCTHEPAVRLAERLLPQLPGAPSRLFYSDDGSTAIEVALKALVQRARRQGVERPLIAAFEDAYHGDTFGAMAVSGRSPFTAAFDPLLFEVERLPTPAGPWDPVSAEAEAHASRALEAFADWAGRNRGRIAAVVVEPLVQGSGGMRMYPRSFLEGMDAICAESGIAWIADEVFTGFGRTGAFFACADLPGRPTLRPAAVCLSKGLTGGALPMGATAFQEEIFADFLSDDRAQTFFHGHSFTGNPLGCAAALASLDLFAMPESQRQRAALEARHRALLADLASRFAIEGARVLGTIAAFEIPARSGGYLSNAALRLRDRCLERGVLLRPLGNTVYILPPYCIEDSEYGRIAEALADSLGG